MLPLEVVLDNIERELEGALAWAERRDGRAQVEWLRDRLEIRVSLVQRETGDMFQLVGSCDRYRAIPPAWSFADEQWNATSDKRHWPKAKKGQSGSSLIHGQPVICAPFNRLAYKEPHGGPHKDWGGPSEWLGVKGKCTGTTIGEMLSTIYRDFRVTEGRMA